MPVVNDTLICNLALSMIGASRILSMQDKTKEAEACLLHYDVTRDEVLRAHPWNFAIARTELTATEEPLFGWNAAFILPSDCLRVLDLNDISATADPPAWTVEGRRLLTNDTDSARIRYIFRNENCIEYDATFIQAFAVRLSATIAKRITNSDSIAAQQFQLYEAEYGPQARLSDLKEHKSKVIPPWVRSNVVKSRGQGWPRHDWGDFVAG